MRKYFDARESASVRQRKMLQDTDLAKMVRLGYKTSPTVKRMLDAAKINPRNVKTREDLEGLPVTSREKLVEMELKRPPYANLENPAIHVDRIFTSPGQIGRAHV